LSINVRPQKVAVGAEWLVNSDLYKEEGVGFNNTWLESSNSVLNNSDYDECGEYPSTVVGVCKHVVMKIIGVKIRRKYLLE
jgi:hypothetical protein